MQRFISEDPIGLSGADENFYAFVENSPVNFYDPLGLSKWYPVPGKPGWEVRRDQPHTSKDYYHEHYKKRKKEVARKVESGKGCRQKKHGKGLDEDVPQDVIDAAKKAFNITGDEEIDLRILEGSEAVNDFLTDLGNFIPPPPGFGIPGFSGVPVSVAPAIP